MNRKTTVGTKVDSEVLQRLERLALADKRSLSATAAMAIAAGLPTLEADVLGDPVPPVTAAPVAPTSAEVAS